MRKRKRVSVRPPNGLRVSQSQQNVERLVARSRACFLTLSVYTSDGSHRDREEVMHILKEDFRLDHKVIQGLRQIILNSSWKQTSKGILTAGLRKSIFYAGQKVAKKWKSTRKKDGAFDSKELTN